jgi:hypothetical protein
VSASAALSIFAALVIPSLIGTLVVRLFLSRGASVHPSYLVGAGTILGWILITLAMRVQQLVGLAATLTHTLILPAITLGVLLYLSRGRVTRTSYLHAIRTPMVKGNIKVTDVALSLFLVFEFAVLALSHFSTPIQAWDSWDFWAARAKTWYLVEDLNDNRLNTNQAYPVAVSLFMVWIARWVGAWHDGLVFTPWLALYVALVLATFGALRAYSTRTLALVGSTVVGSMPLLVTHGAMPGYADLPMAASVTAAVGAVALWLKEVKATKLAVLAIVFSACSAMFKVPGAVWAVLVLCCLVLERYGAFRKLPNRNAVGVGLALVTISGLVFAHLNNLKFGNYEVKPFNDNWVLFVQHAMQFESFTFVVAAALITSVVLRHSYGESATLRLHVHFAAFTALFLLVAVGFTNSVEFWADGSILTRALLHAMPACVVLLFVVLSEARPLSRAHEQSSHKENVSGM